MPEIKVKDERDYTDRIISHYGNGTGYMAIRCYDDGEKRTVHTGSRLPKAKTSHVNGRTNVGSAADNLKRMK
jgi:hypothetical protein